VRLYVGDDWAEDHHDIEVMNEAGKVLAKKRLPEGAAGMSQFHELTGRLLPEGAEDAEVVIGIETDRGPWVAALVAVGYTVYPVNPLQASRYRERHAVSGAKSDGGDAHMLADMVRTDSHQLRPAAGDSPEVEGVKVVARMHKTMIWERTRAVQRLRHFPEPAVAVTRRISVPSSRERISSDTRGRRGAAARTVGRRVFASNISAESVIISLLGSFRIRVL